MAPTLPLKILKVGCRPKHLPSRSSGDDEAANAEAPSTPAPKQKASETPGCNSCRHLQTSSCCFNIFHNEQSGVILILQGRFHRKQELVNSKWLSCGWCSDPTHLHGTKKPGLHAEASTANREAASRTCSLAAETGQGQKSLRSFRFILSVWVCLGVLMKDFGIFSFWPETCQYHLDPFRLLRFDNDRWQIVAGLQAGISVRPNITL